MIQIVNTFNGCDPLEEVIVGNLDEAVFPPWHLTLEATMPSESWKVFQTKGGQPFPPSLIEAAKRELDEFVHILEAEGVKVVRPDLVDYSKPFSTPDRYSPKWSLWSDAQRPLVDHWKRNN